MYQHRTQHQAMDQQAQDRSLPQADAQAGNEIDQEDRNFDWLDDDRVPTEEVFRRRFRLDLPLPRRPKDMADEIKYLRSALEGAYRRIAYLENLADTDPLVPAFNRRAFLRELNRAVAFSTRYGIPSSVVYLDINDLKKVNDKFGHSAGDTLISHVAQQLVRNVRQSDAVGRLGGDEFAILLLHTDEHNASRKGAALSDMITGTPLEWGGEEIDVAVSWGVHSIMPGETAEAALSGADKAMYQTRNGA
jgi:diguanylate cyclase (GGDEF)-like protein